MNKNSNKRLQRTRHKVSGPLTRDVRQKMKTIIITLALFGVIAPKLQAQDPPLSAEHMRTIHERLFTDVQKCDLASESYQEIHIGSPLTDIMTLKDTPLPPGLYWPNFTQKDGSTITMQGTTLPPDKWGTNYITRIDGLTSKQFCFFHDGTNVVRIAYASLQLTSMPPKQPKENRVPYEPKGPWIMEKEK